MWSSDRTALRAVFHKAWQRFLQQSPLEGVEPLIVEALVAHPEYQGLFAAPEAMQDHADAAQVNPFLHLGLHIALAEQFMTDRPFGVVAEWHRLRKAVSDEHRARHLMMECLEESLWAAQRTGVMPDEGAYLACLRALPKKPVRGQ